MPPYSYTHPTSSPHYINPTHTITKISRTLWQITSPSLPSPLDFPSYSAAKAYASTQTFEIAPTVEVANPSPVETTEPEQTEFGELTTEQHIQALVTIASTLPDPTGCIALAISQLDGIALCGHLVDSETEAGSVAVDNIRAYVSGLGSTFDRIAEAYGVGAVVSESMRLGVVLDDLRDRPEVVRWVAQTLIAGEDSWVGRLGIECALMRGGCNGGRMVAQEGKSAVVSGGNPAEDWRYVWALVSGEWDDMAREDVGEMLRGRVLHIGADGGLMEGVGDASALLLPEPEHRLPLSDGRSLIVNWSEDVRPDGSVWGKATVWLDDASGLSLLANWTPHSGIGWRSSSVAGVDLVALDRLLEVINDEGLAIAR
jgi:hypothetical protein